MMSTERQKRKYVCMCVCVCVCVCVHVCMYADVWPYQQQLFLRCTDADAMVRGHQWKRRLAGREQWRAIN